MTALNTERPRSLSMIAVVGVVVVEFGLGCGGLFNPAGAKLSEAEEKEQAGDLKMAVALYDEVVKSWPDSEEAKTAKVNRKTAAHALGTLECKNGWAGQSPPAIDIAADVEPTAGCAALHVAVEWTEIGAIAVLNGVTSRKALRARLAERLDGRELDDAYSSFLPYLNVATDAFAYPPRAQNAKVEKSGNDLQVVVEYVQNASGEDDPVTTTPGKGTTRYQLTNTGRGWRIREAKWDFAADAEEGQE